MWTNFGRVYWTEILSEVGLRVNDYLFSFFSFLQNSYLCDQEKSKVNFNCNSVTEIDLTEIIVYMNTSDKYFAVCMSLLKDCSFITYSCYSLWWDFRFFISVFMLVL